MSYGSPSNSASSSSSTKKRGGPRNPSSSNSKKNHFKQSPFTDFGSYMTEKNRKLRQQFAAAVVSSSSLASEDPGGGGMEKGIFRGVSIFIDGFTVPSSQELKDFMLKHGGRFENYFSRRRVTHIICSNLPDSKMKNFRAFSRGLPVVKPAWILECVVANKLLSWVPYQLSELVNESGKQRKLSSFFTPIDISSSIDADNIKDPCTKVDDEDMDTSMKLLPLGEISLSNCNGEDDAGSLCFGHERVYEEINAEARFTDLEDEQTVVEASSASPCRPSDMTSGSCTDNTAEFLGASNHHHSTLGGPKFVENYFKNSRLHFIGTWRNRYRKRFLDKLKGVKHKNANVNSIFLGKRASVIHIDMDSFFVSVVIRNYPELVNKPVAVCHSDSPKGTAEISSANYPAREYGVKAGMFVRDAKARCPNLVIVPYDFEAYEEVADQFYSILHKHCDKIQAVSCDEAFLDVTEATNNEPEDLVQMIRKEIAETTRCTASAGIAENMLLARLATRSAKPNGQCFISSEKVDGYLKDLPVKALPGIGHSLGEKMKSRQIHTCGQLRLISKETLHKEFGTKTGDMLWNYCRGVDNRAVEAVQETKSVGAEVNWGVRFNDIADCEHFLLDLCKEISFRLQECGVEGHTVTLKVKKRKQGAEEPAKFMGCGDCESMSRSMTLPFATDDVVLLERIAKQMFVSLHIDVKEVRGVGLQISRLETVDLNKRGREKDVLESWLSSGKTKGETSSPLNPGDHRDALFSEKKPDCGIQQDDTSFQPCCVNQNPSSGPSRLKLSSGGSHDSRTLTLPALCHLDIEVVKNLPPEIFSEMNDMYHGKLYDFMKKYIDDDGKANAKSTKIPLEENTTYMSFTCQKIDSDADGNLAGGQAPCLEPYTDTKNKGKRPVCSPELPVCNFPFQSERVQSSVANALDSFGKHPVNDGSQIVDTSKINLWLGNPPKWVEMFKDSNCFLLNIVADMYAKSGRSCKLSSIFQSLFSQYPSDLDLTVGGWDEALSSLYDLITQYIDLNIESDIEELYICFRLLKRFTSTSKFLFEVYNIVLPSLQVSVNEQYGGHLQLSFNE
ncbi:uncharacterized protein A4U43_C08F18290 [Asparagus officinalis]|uniref:DNA repair protein REV1 isoform X2 n=1 Tax=Asparagus officinalis TaxID=4686 RepID=UPI00098E3FB3|nr:DNA repair protein REV1 isoform X2 [Asparagus officinalis]ONK60421.1 uncharacterized protein A4U43_C08F18290 [Asparagus officinalis]